MPPRRSKSHLFFFAFLSFLLIALSLCQLTGFSKPDKREALNREQARKDPPKAAFAPPSLSWPSSASSNTPFPVEKDPVETRTAKGDPETFWLEVQKKLAATIREKIPEARLSDRDVRDLTRDIRTLRDSLQAASETERRLDNAEALKDARGRIDWTQQIFRETTGLTVAEFIQRVREEKGIDHDASEDEEVVFEYIHDPRP
jgi:hypothetical protein